MGKKKLDRRKPAYYARVYMGCRIYCRLVYHCLLDTTGESNDRNHAKIVLLSLLFELPQLDYTSTVHHEHNQITAISTHDVAAPRLVVYSNDSRSLHGTQWCPQIRAL